MLSGHTLGCDHDNDGNGGDDGDGYGRDCRDFYCNGPDNDHDDEYCQYHNYSCCCSCLHVQTLHMQPVKETCRLFSPTQLRLHRDQRSPSSRCES